MHGILLVLPSLLVAALGSELAASSEQLQPRFFFETEAKRGQFPYMANIIAGNRWYYGGSLVTRTAVLTDALCITRYTNWRVILGTTSLDANEGSWSTDSSKAKVHPEFNSTTMQNAVGIIFLKTKAPLYPYIQPVGLPSSEELYDSFVGATAILTGWGEFSNDTRVARVLRWTDMRVVENSVCVKHYPPKLIGGSTLCAVKEGMNICKGDYGSPLVLKRKNVFTLIGVVTLRLVAGCDSPGPSGFTRITSVIKWITTVTA